MSSPSGSGGRTRSGGKLQRQSSGVSNRSFAMYGGDVGGVAAMQNNDYMNKSFNSNTNCSTTALDTVEIPPDGCWQKFTNGVRSVWKTRHTEDTSENKELYISTTLRELIIYCVFLIVLVILAFGMMDSNMFYYTQVLTGLFQDSSLDGNDGDATFGSIGTIDDYWMFLKGPLMSGLYWTQWYNKMNITPNEQNYIYYENKLLGVPRIRQVKVNPKSCDIPEDFQNEIKQCFAMYDSSVADKDPFGPGNSSAWNYTEAGFLAGSLDYQGHMGSYDANGFLIDLTRNQDDSLAIIEDLFNSLWITRGTRAVFIDFTVYNANINLFCVVKLVVEFPATGGAMATGLFRTVKLLRYVTPMDYFVLCCECVFIFFILYYIIEEIIEIRKNKLVYFKNFFNVLDIGVIIVSLVCAVFNVYRTMAVGNKLESLLDDPNLFPDFDFLSYWQIQFNNAIGFTVFFAWVKIFKYISFNKTMTQLSSTLGACAKDLAGFAVMFFIIFFAFAQLGYLIFGTQVEGFRQFSTAIFTLFRIILGDFDFNSLEAAHRILGPIYFILYVFFVFFILLNMFLAIINDTYSEVKGELAQQENEFEMGDYFKQHASKVMNKLNFKRDKILDIQKAMQAADMNNDKKLDFDEWRNELKQRGYADAEIEAVFSKFDLDGDRVLDMSEQLRMQAHLEAQKKAINIEIEKENEGVDEADEDECDVPPKAPSGRGGGVTVEEFTVLTRRIDRMETSIGNIVGKIDSVLVKLGDMEKTKYKRREATANILNSISNDESLSDEQKRTQMEGLVRQELNNWDNESVCDSRAPSRISKAF